jgi:hypothetical protein
MYPRFVDWPSERLEVLQCGPGDGQRRSGEIPARSRRRQGRGKGSLLPKGSISRLGRVRKRAGEVARRRPAVVVAASYNLGELGVVWGN